MFVAITLRRSASAAVTTPSEKLTRVRFLIQEKERSEKQSWARFLVCCKNTGNVLKLREEFGYCMD